MNTTQNERLLSYLETHSTITPMEAWEKLGIYRLGGRIFDLRLKGHKIETKYVPVLNRFNETCNVARYRLLEPSAHTVHVEEVA